MAVNLASCIAFAYSARREIPQLHLRPGFSRLHFRSLLRHSKFIVVGNVSNQLVGSADNFVIGFFLPVANLAYYGIAYNLAQRLWTLVVNVVSVVFPAASSFSGSEQSGRRINELYVRGTKTAALFACFPACALALFGREFLLHWLTPDYAANGAIVLSLLALGFMVNSFSSIPVQVLQGTHHASTAAKGSVLYAAINLVLFFVLIPQFGIKGAAIAFFAAQLLFVPAFIALTNRILQVRWQPVVFAFVRVLATTAAACLCCWMLRGLIHSMFSLAIVVCFGLLIYALLAYRFVLDATERDSCRAVLLSMTAALRPERRAATAGAE
jgi:O-antigen/teichoic acid export membrane protein